MAIVRVTTSTFRQGQVRAGYDYDDATNEVTSFWCEDDSARKNGITMTLPDSKDRDKPKIEPFVDKEVKDVSADKITLVLQDGVLALPFPFEKSYAWR